ncbi:MAG TPA: hypothetical protein VLA32_06480 [Anaerolineales bacterium]|nr:hypothetical protein [Anaerolineales bacterium]
MTDQLVLDFLMVESISPRRVLRTPCTRAGGTVPPDPAKMLVFGEFDCKKAQAY